MQNIDSLQPTPNRTSANPTQLQDPVTCPLKVYLQFLDLKKRFNWLHNEHEMLCMISAEKPDVLCSINKDNSLLPLTNLNRLGGRTLSILSKQTMRTMKACRCKFDNSNIKQMRDFPKDKGNCYRGSLRKQIKLLKFSEICFVTEVTTDVWRRDEQVHDLRTELSLHALHSEDVTQQQNQEFAGKRQHLTRLLRETQQYREMFEISRAPQ